MKRLLHLLTAIALLMAVSAPLRAGTLVRFGTLHGTVVVEMLDQEKPVTVQNFLRYVDAGLYKDMFFHRCVSNFVMQGGGFGVTNRGAANASVVNVPEFPRITNEFAVGPFRSNVRGTIAMAKTSDPNSATSQFFFNTANNASSLDNPANSGGFTVFGRVIAGDAALELWRTFARYSSAITNRVQTNITANACQPANPNCVFSELPLSRIIDTESIFDELLFVEVSRVPDLKLTAKPGLTRTVQWDSGAGVPYVVEYATNLPATNWQKLADQIGTGATVSVTDPVASGPRYYRLRLGP